MRCDSSFFWSHALTVAAPPVLVKVLASGVCHTDAAAVHGLIGAKHPLVPGHEVVGDVAAVGPSEKRWKVGDRVGAGGLRFC